MLWNLLFPARLGLALLGAALDFLVPDEAPAQAVDAVGPWAFVEEL